MANDQDLQPLLDVRQNQLSIIFGESNSIDTKGLALVGTSVAILIFAAQASLKIRHWYLGTLLLGGLVLSIGWSLVALYPYAYKGPGVNLDTHPEYLEMDSESLVLQLIADVEAAITHDVRLNKWRWRAILASFACLSLGTLALFAIIKA